MGCHSRPPKRHQLAGYRSDTYNATQPLGGQPTSRGGRASPQFVYIARWRQPPLRAGRRWQCRTKPKKAESVQNGTPIWQAVAQLGTLKGGIIFCRFLQKFLVGNHSPPQTPPGVPSLWPTAVAHTIQFAHHKLNFFGLNSQEIGQLGRGWNFTFRKPLIH